MPNLEGIRIKIRNHIYIPLTCKHRNKKIANPNFTIIFNNCWGGTVYEAYNLQKQSPFVGMFIMADDYIKLLQNLREYLSNELQFISFDESKYKDELSNNKFFGSYPIAMLGDIELHLLHYHDSEDVIVQKWNRRVKRIKWDRLLVKFNDQNGCTEKNLQDFLDLPYRNKLFFTSRDWNISSPCIIKLKQYKNPGHALASYEPFGQNKKIDIPAVINNL